MFTIALGAGVGILMLVFRVLEMKKNKAAIEKAQGEMKFEILDYSKGVTLFLASLVLPSILCVILGILEKSETNIAFGVLLIFLFIAEAMNAKDISKLYYNETGAIVNKKFVRYKSMKAIRKNHAVPFAKYTLTTFNNEKLTLARKAALKVAEIGKIDINHLTGK